MEQMLPELEDLEERGYFNKGEIKLILRRRAYFEYLMKRKTVLKADVLRYATRTHELRRVSACFLAVDNHWSLVKAL